MLTQN